MFPIPPSTLVGVLVGLGSVLRVNRLFRPTIQPHAYFDMVISSYLWFSQIPVLSMLYFYDSSPYSIDTQRGLKPSCALSDAHWYIICLIWGEDAVALWRTFILSQTGLFDLHLVVQDEDLQVQRASNLITQCLPYNICLPIPDGHLERFFFFDLSQSLRTFPHSVCSSRWQLPMTNATWTAHRWFTMFILITVISIRFPPHEPHSLTPSRWLNIWILLVVGCTSGRTRCSWISYFLTYPLRKTP